MREMLYNSQLKKLTKRSLKCMHCQFWFKTFKVVTWPNICYNVFLSMSKLIFCKSVRILIWCLRLWPFFRTLKLNFCYCLLVTYTDSAPSIQRFLSYALLFSWCKQTLTCSSTLRTLDGALAHVLLGVLEQKNKTKEDRKSSPLFLECVWLL